MEIPARKSGPQGEPAREAEAEGGSGPLLCKPETPVQRAWWPSTTVSYSAWLDGWSTSPLYSIYDPLVPSFLVVAGHQQLFWSLARGQFKILNFLTDLGIPQPS